MKAIAVAKAKPKEFGHTLINPYDAHEIYTIVNTVTGKMYVGQTSCYIKSTRDGFVKAGWEKRWLSHKQAAARDDHKSCIVFYNAIAKYGVDAFVCTPYLTCAAADIDDWEERLIAEFNTVKPHGYNLKLGGDAHRHHDDTKVRIGLANTGKVRARRR